MYRKELHNLDLMQQIYEIIDNLSLPLSILSWSNNKLLDPIISLTSLILEQDTSGIALQSKYL